MIGPLTGLLVLLDAGGFAVLVMLSYVLLTVIRGGCGRGSRLAFAVAVHSYPACPDGPLWAVRSSCDKNFQHLLPITINTNGLRLCFDVVKNGKQK